MKYCNSCPDNCPLNCASRIVLYFEVFPNPVTDSEWHICFPVFEHEHAEELYHYVDTHESFRGFDVVPDSAILLYPRSFDLGSADTSSAG